MKKGQRSIGISVSILIFIAIIAGGYFLFKPISTTEQPLEETSKIQKSVTDPEAAPPETLTDTSNENTIEITSSGFSPKTLDIKKGDKVNFINKGSSSSWPASAIHPTHKVYPDSGINKCGTAEEANIFDACGGLENQETYSFTFNEIGSWNYHNHLNPSKTGTISVS